MKSTDNNTVKQDAREQKKQERREAKRDNKIMDDLIKRATIKGALISTQ